MQGTIAQAVGLVIFGNDFMRGHEINNFWPDSTVFTFCKTVRFVELNGAQEAAFSSDPTSWFAALRDRDVQGFRLHHLSGQDRSISDRMSVGFVGGGGRWFIETAANGRSDLWEARWSVKDQHDPQRKIWEVVYTRVAKDRPRIQVAGRSLATLRRDLEETLSAIADFAEEHKIDFFASSFRHGLELLRAAAPLSGIYHADFDRVVSLPLEAKQLLGAVLAAWVFGGMGSWNDLGFDGNEQARYESLSERLFMLMVEITVEATNASFAEVRRG